MRSWWRKFDVAAAPGELRKVYKTYVRFHHGLSSCLAPSSSPPCGTSISAPVRTTVSGYCFIYCRGSKAVDRICSHSAVRGPRPYSARPAGFGELPEEKVQCVVIGAGVIGLAIARQLALSGKEVIVVESGSTFGTGTSSRNSEVVHGGLYYPPGSLKVHFPEALKKQTAC